MSYHHKMEPISNFSENDFKKDDLQNNCRMDQNKMIGMIILKLIEAYIKKIKYMQNMKMIK